MKGVLTGEKKNPRDQLSAVPAVHNPLLQEGRKMNENPFERIRVSHHERSALGEHVFQRVCNPQHVAVRGDAHKRSHVAADEDFSL